MGTEIERKFLTTNEDWRQNARVDLLRQGYLSTDKNAAVRVRLCGDKAKLAIKGPPVDGVALEFEYDIPPEDAATMLDALARKPLIEKKRHVVLYKGVKWEIDEFFGENEGLVLAEVELASPDQRIETPPWIGEEVTGDPRYYNANLVAYPFCAWGAARSIDNTDKT